MKTILTLVAASIFVACGAAPGDSGAAPGDINDPSGFRQQGANSYTPDGHSITPTVKLIDGFSGQYVGNQGGPGYCNQEVDNGTNSYLALDNDHTVGNLVGTWSETGTQVSLCVAGVCATCTKPSSAPLVHEDGCRAKCDKPLPVLWNRFETPYAFTCDASGSCTRLSGESVNADGTVSFQGTPIGTWRGSHAQVEICYRNYCQTYSPTKN